MDWHCNVGLSFLGSHSNSASSAIPVSSQVPGSSGKCLRPNYWGSVSLCSVSRLIVDSVAEVDSSAEPSHVDHGDHHSGRLMSDSDGLTPAPSTSAPSNRSTNDEMPTKAHLVLTGK